MRLNRIMTRLTSGEKKSIKARFENQSRSFSLVASTLRFSAPNQPEDSPNMASANVDKVLLTLQENGVLAAELQLVFAKLEASAGVDLTKEEKKEFLKELSELTSREILIVWF